ncbi:hypothetical protein TNCV_4804511 [Trichonephila clavipes]|nr:hypothetical protein TNCV_4804511 [Trichonephila clavipes]
MAKISSSGHPLSNDTFPDPMHPLAPEEIEAQGQVKRLIPELPPHLRASTLREDSELLTDLTRLTFPKRWDISD